jgi:hypothetical protein
VQVHYDEGVATYIGPEPCVDVREDCDEASVGEGISQPLSRESLDPGCRRCFECGRQHEQARHRERLVDPAWSKNLACADAPCTGTGRSRDRPFGNRRRSVSGRRGAVADDARSREVRLCHSSWEADEQSRATGRGAGGAKGGGQGECEPAKHAPDSEPGKRVPRAGAHTANRNEKRFAVTHPRREPYARIGPVRICANSLAFGGWPAVPLRAAFERILKYRIVAGKASADATSVPSA